MVQVEILRNAILYIQSLERCLGLSCDRGGDSEVELETKVKRSSWLKAPTSTFTLKTLLRHSTLY